MTRRLYSALSPAAVLQLAATGTPRTDKGVDVSPSALFFQWLSCMDMNTARISSINQSLRHTHKKTEKKCVFYL
jgi:hypothetical protein